MRVSEALDLGSIPNMTTKKALYDVWRAFLIVVGQFLPHFACRTVISAVAKTLF